MYRRDYVLRLIERFGRMLIALRNRILKRELEGEQARAEIHDLAEEAGLDLNVARQLDPQMLVMWLAPTGDIDEPKFWLMGELLYLAGLESRSSGERDGGQADMERALALFSRLPAGWKPHLDLASAGERADDLRLMLNRP